MNNRTVIILPFALALLLPIFTISAHAGGEVIYEGTFTASGLSWSDTGDGTVVPVLAGTRSLEDTDIPELVGRSLTLLVPLDIAVGDIEVVPLATHGVSAPAPLRVAGKAISSEGIAVGQSLHGDAESSVYPSAWGRYGGVQIFRGFKMATVTVYPLRATRTAAGDWGSLEFLDRFEVRLRPSLVPVALESVAVRQRKVPGERARLERILAATVDNPGTLSGYQREDGITVAGPAKGFAPSKTPSLSGSDVAYLIITSDGLASAFEPLAVSRTAQGLPAVVKTISWIEDNYRHGVDIQETIRMFIRDAYQRWGVEYVLLGGDTDIVPARFITSDFYPPGGSTDIPADLYFACLDGNWNADGDMIFGEPNQSVLNPGDDCDMSSDIGFGRAPVSNAAAATVFVNKVIAQESAQTGSGFGNRFMFAAEVLFRNQDGDITLDGANYAEGLVDSVIEPCTDMEYIRLYESYDERDEFDQLLYPGSVNETRRAVLDSLDTGRYGIFNQIGHGFFFDMSVGDLNITGGDADALTNENTFLMYALNCASAAFDYSCLMERFVQNPNGGSFASIGASRAAFPSTANDFQVEFFNQLMCEGEPRLGDLMTLSRLPWLDFASTNSFTRWTYMNYTLLGDPAQKMWTADPAAVVIAAPGSLVTGQQTVNVTVTSGGSPVVGARVTLARTGGVYVRDVTDGVGQVALPVTLTEGGDLTLTVNGTNIEQTSVTVTVSNPGAYIALESMTVIDDGTLGSSGNGNGVIEAGETVALAARFEDTGTGGATGLTATLTTTTPGLVLNVGVVAVPDVPSGGSVAASAPFLVAAHQLMWDGMNLDFTIEVDDGGSSWFSEWGATMMAPEVEPIALTWFDTFYGNSDGIVDDNERISIVLRLKNFGAGFADMITGYLRTNSPNVTLHDTVVTYTGLALMDTSNGAALFSMAVIDTSQAYDARIDFVDNMGRTFTHDFQIVDPDVPQGIDSGLTLGADVIELVWDPVAGDDARGYHVYRSDAEGGPYARANVDLLEGISYFRDSGLDLLTRYYYRVSAVNTSLIEGDQSDPFAKSTAPPETGDFPLPFGRETDSHCAVGDVTGDGRLEVVLTADEVYVWTEDGGELFDGDDNAQTRGPITNLTGRLTAMAVTLAELDGEPGAEIICSDRDLKLIYVFKSDGTLLPGWPQSTGAGWVWAPAAVGDIDGDGEPEIVCNNLNRVTLAWHADGTEVRDGDSNPATNGPLIDRTAELSWAGWNRSGPALFDLDHDGAKDIIFGTRYGWETTNSLRAYRWDGTQLPGFPIETGGGGSIMVSPTVADLDADGIWEIIFVSEDDQLHVVHENGSYYTGFPIYFRAQSDNGDRTCPSPAVGDFDDDGELEIVAVEVFGSLESYVHLIDTDYVGGTSGETMPGWPIMVPGNSNSNPVVGDINGDGMLDILFGIGGGNTESPNNLYAFKHDGTDVEGFPLSLGGPVNPTPVICDLDRDHDVDIVYGGWDLLIHVWDMPYAFDGTEAPWLTFRGNNLRDGVFRILSTTEVPDIPKPSRLTLQPNHPNPFNPSTEVKLYIPGDAGEVDLRVDVYDMAGRRVRSLHQGTVSPGWHSVTWEGRDDRGQPQASGVYFLRARTGGADATVKMSLVK
ncbi:T9SS type A sorting domain-containing protein [bacterium]|nr:T9SS type A sorting domain-containing protein [bacterium]